MPFRFPLASVLRFRESVEKREEVALQKVQLEVARVQRRFDGLTDELAKMYEYREQTLRGTTRANTLQLMQSEISATEEARQNLSAALDTLRRQRDAQMKQYMKARSGRQMLADLSAQQKDLYELEQERLQQKQLDDVVATRWQRN